MNISVCVSLQSSYLSPDPSGVMKVVFVIRELPDAVVDSDTTLARCHVVLRHLNPAQRAHCETLTVQMCCILV